MIQTENKKIPVRLILTSLIVLIIAYLIKEPNDYTMLRFLQEQRLSVPLYLYDVNILGITLPYKSIVIITIILLGIGCYWYLYKTDQEIEHILMLEKIKSALGTSTTKSRRTLIIFLVVMIAVIIGIIYFASYVIELNNSTKPKSWGESLLLGIGTTFLGVVAISIVMGLIKSVINKKTNNNEKNY